MDGLHVLQPMPPQDLLAKGHTAAATDAAAAHGRHPSPVAVTDHGKERKRRRKHEDAAGAAAGVVAAAARSSEIDDDVAGNDGAAADGARRRRRPRAPAPERTGAGASGYTEYDYDDASGPRDRGGFSAVGHFSDSAPATARTKAIVTRSRHRHRAAAAAAVAGGYSTGGGASSYHAAAASTSSFSRPVLRDERPASPRRPPAMPHGAHYSGGGVSRYESPSPPARPPSGIVIGGSKHRHHQAGSSSGGAGGACYYAAAANASSSSSRLIREPAAPPRHHVAKPPKAHGAPSSSASASAPPLEHDDDDERYYRVGLEMAMKMDEATLLSLVKEYAGAGVMGQGHGQHPPAAEAVEEKRFSYWLTDEEADADLRKVDEYYLEAERRKAAAGNGKRRPH